MKILFIILLLLSLSACSSLELAHDPLRCITTPLPKLSDSMTYEEIEPLTDLAFGKIETHVVTLEARIEGQCDLIIKHNENHNKE